MNVGHGRAEIADAVREQVAKLAYYPTTRQFSNPPAARLAARLAGLTPGDLTYTLFAVSGSEANERSMQIARVYWLKVGRPRKYKVISLTYGYHGATLATLAICGQPDMVRPYEPLAWQGFRKVAAPYPMWDRGAGTDEDLVRRCADRLAATIREEDPETVAAVILEPCLSSGGCIIPPLGWLERVRDICDELDVLMIADEVITGFGRTGKWFGVDHESVVPDLMSVAKGITSGYIPLSASIAREKLADGVSRGQPRGERAPEHLLRPSGGVRRGARQPGDPRAREPRAERRGDGRAPARGDRGARARSADRRRGALARADGGHRFHRPRAARPAARPRSAWRA